MPRALSTAAKHAIFAPETGEIFLTLATITHPNMPAPLYFVNNMQDVVSRGHTYVAWPFQIALPAETDDQIPNVQLQIDNVDREIMAAIRVLPSPPLLTLEIVLASSADTVEAGPFVFQLRQVEYDAQTISGTLAFEGNILSEPYPSIAFTPAYFPGLFK